MLFIIFENELRIQTAHSLLIKEIHQLCSSIRVCLEQTFHYQITYRNQHLIGLIVPVIEYKSIGVTSAKNTISLRSSFFLLFAISAFRRSSTVDLIIRFIVLLTEKSSYVQISFFLSILCVFIDSAISILPRSDDKSSV